MKLKFIPRIIRIHNINRNQIEMLKKIDKKVYIYTFEQLDICYLKQYRLPAHIKSFENEMYIVCLKQVYSVFN